MPILEDPVTTWLAFGCTWVSNVLCVYLIVQHIRNYTQPGFQRYICRIIFIVPFYCTASWLALLHRESSIYFETPRDCYEAWVIYNFMSLCMAYVGGPGAVVVKSEGKLIQPSWLLCTCCMKPIPVDGFFLRNCKQGTLQFVIAKPILAFLTLGLFVMDLYQVGNWNFNDGFVYEAIIYNFCYSLALFWMLLFYVGTEELLKPYKPLMKFFVFKTVIFLTFWQGMVVTFFATRFGWSPEDSEAMQNWLICVEMFFAAVGMLFAFPYQEYLLGGSSTPGFRWEAFKHAVSITDVLEDIIFQFNPNYKAYVLHTDGGPSENVKRKKFRGKKKKKPAFTVIQNELGALGEKITKMSKLKGQDRKRLTRVSGDLDAEMEEGGVWHSAARRDTLLKNLQGGLQSLADKPQALVSWIPGITELERRQAELLDSDSDAEYDEDNQRDNQLDDDVLTDSSGDEDADSPRRALRAGAGRLRADSSGDEARGPRRLPGGSDSEGGKAGRGRNAQNGAGTADWANFPAAPGEVQGMSRRADDSWAQFPPLGREVAVAKPQEDSSWADFGSPAAVTAVAAAAAETPTRNGSATPVDQNSRDVQPVEQSEDGPGAEIGVQEAAAESLSVPEESLEGQANVEDPLGANDEVKSYESVEVVNNQSGERAPAQGEREVVPGEAEHQEGHENSYVAPSEEIVISPEDAEKAVPNVESMPHVQEEQVGEEGRSPDVHAMDHDRQKE